MDDMSAVETGAGRILREVRGDIFLIGIDRAAKRNAFTPAMLREYAGAFTEYENAEECRCAVVYAEGDHFTGGLDLERVAPRFASGEPLFPDGCIDPLDLREPRRTKPVVVAVQGWCLTIGIETMLAADVAVASADARFAQVEVQRNLVATGGATVRMVRRAGWGNAMRYLLTGDVFDAETALRLGFVQEIAPVGEHKRRALEIARRIADQAPLAVRATLANARVALDEGREASVAHAHELQKRLRAGADAAEGLAAFAERRPGRFKGR